MRLLCSVSPGQWRVAAWDGALRDYAIHRPGAPDGVGDLHRGRVTAHVPAMAGAFVELCDATGFLPDSEAPERLTTGLAIGVRITRAAQSGKGPRLTARLDPGEAVGSGPPTLLRRGPDPLARLAALYPNAPIDIDDAGTLAKIELTAKLSSYAFADEVEEQVAALADSTAALPGGATLHIYPTPALTALDVDLGAGTATRRDKAGAQAEANRALLPALARQIRLRNLSGAIVVDLGGMPARKRASLAPAFTQALAGDPLAPQFLGFTALGLAEILRPRIHPPLHELLAGPHAAGLAALRALAQEIAATPSRRPLLRAAPTIVQALEADPSALESLATRAGQRLILQSDHALAPLGWSLVEPPRV